MNYINYLKELGVSFRATPFSDDLLTCTDVSRELGITEAQIAKAMVCMWHDGRAVIAVLPGDKRLNLKKVRAAIGATKTQLRLAEKTDIEALGMTVGAVTPFAKINKSSITVVVDDFLVQYPEINVSSGNPQMGLMIPSTDLVELLDALVADIRRD